MKPLQDLYPDDFAHCYGCGRLNAHGFRVKSEWRNGEAVARFQPSPQHIALPGYVYGGLVALLIDCHAMATAAAASMEKAGATPGVETRSARGTRRRRSHAGRDGAQPAADGGR